MFQTIRAWGSDFAGNQGGLMQRHGHYLLAGSTLALAWAAVSGAAETTTYSYDSRGRLIATSWPAPDQDLAAFASRLAADNPEGFLVQISCTYGGDVVLTCREIEVFDRA